MGLTVLPQYELGGVDSRSNPLNFPRNRCLRCLNWDVTEAATLVLRWGYAVTNQQAALGSRPVNFISYKKLDGTKQVVLFDGSAPKTMALSTGAVTNPTIRGTAFASAAKGSFVFVNNRLHYYNGTDKKFFDGTTWRDIGVRSPSGAEAAAVNAALSGGAGVLPASTVGGSQPGYQLWMAYYNPTTGDISDAVKIGARLVPGSPKNIDLTGLPNLSGVDTELVKLIGRTADGGSVAYAAADTAGNWFTVANAATTATLNVSEIDGNAEMPSRNSQPRAFDKVALAGDYVWGNENGSATIYRSGNSLLKRQGVFPGNPEACFAANDIETFPPNSAVSCIAEYNQDPWVFSRQDMAILSVDQQGNMFWDGPWHIGCAGQRAFAKGPDGPYWLSGDKQLCTMTAQGPVPISSEYEAALLSKIGPGFIGESEVKYIRDVAKGLDRLHISCIDANGVPFQVIHDFKLRDERSPFGQGREQAYKGVLSLLHSIEAIRDNDDALKIWAGGLDGRLYELYNGNKDNASEYSADLVLLINGGGKRVSAPEIYWYGDQNVVMSIGKRLKTSLDPAAQFTFEVLDKEAVVPEGENDYFWKAKLKSPEIRNAYLRIQLDSHSADGTLDLNSPPHLPLENYGRVYVALAGVGSQRDTV